MKETGKIVATNKFESLSFGFVLMLALSYLLVIVPILGVAFLLMKYNPILKENFVAMIAISLFIGAILCLFVLYKLSIKKNISFADLGFVKPSSRMFHLLWQIPLLFIGILLSQALLFLIVGEQNMQGEGGISSYLTETSIFVAIILLLCMDFLIPLVEEIIFRGYVYGKLHQAKGTAVAIFGSAVLFSVFHLVPLLLLYFFVMGSFLAWFRHFHGNIWAPLLAHMCINTSVSLIVLFNLRGV